MGEYSPEVDKVDELGGELPLLRVAELRGLALHHLRQLIEHAVPLGVGKPAGGQLVLRTDTRTRTHGHTDTDTDTHTHTVSELIGGKGN